MTKYVLGFFVCLCGLPLFAAAWIVGFWYCGAKVSFRNGFDWADKDPVTGQRLTDEGL